MHSETRLLEIMKQTAGRSVKSWIKHTFFVGVVSPISPLEVELDQKKTIRRPTHFNQKCDGL